MYSWAWAIVAAASTVAALGSALSFLHASHVYHRDIKPDNMFLVRASGAPLDAELLQRMTEDVILQALDAGHVRIVLGDYDMATLAPCNFLDTVRCGTPNYSPPEVMGRALPSADCSLRAQLVALEDRVDDGVERRPEVVVIEYGRRMCLPRCSPGEHGSVAFGNPHDGGLVYAWNREIRRPYDVRHVDTWMAAATIYLMATGYTIDEGDVNELTMHQVTTHQVATHERTRHNSTRHALEAQQASPHPGSDGSGVLRRFPPHEGRPFFMALESALLELLKVNPSARPTADRLSAIARLLAAANA